MRALLALALCAAMPALAGECTPEALEGEWRILTLASVPVPEEATIGFVAGTHLAAHLGCNRMSGAFALARGVLRAGPLAATRMACPPDALDRDTAIARLMETGTACRIDASGHLVLGNAAAPALIARR